MVQEEDLAYVGGLMDGDGSFSLCRRVNHKGVNLLHYPLIQFGTLNSKVAEMLKDSFGGTCSHSATHIKKDGIVRRDFYRWNLQKSGKCLPFLEKVIPYLEIKKDRAEFLMDFIKRNPFKRGSVPLDEKTVFSRENDYLKMKEFNDERTFRRNLVKQTRNITTDVFFWPYLAGLLDTDGSFSIKKEKTGRFSAQILLTQTDIRGINKIRRNIPFGTIFLVKAKTTQLGACYRFGIYRKEELKEILPLIIPYIQVKKRQAEMLLNFCKNQNVVLHRRGGMPKEELDFRENCYKSILMLNKYGVFKPSLIDLEAQAGDRAEGESRGERLSEMASKEDAIV